MSFDEYAHARLTALLRTATAITGDPHLAEEIVQDVLAKLARRWDQLGPIEHRDAYVRRMLVNEYVSWRRKWARLVPTAEVAGSSDEPDVAERSVERDALSRELAQLSRRQQVVLALRYFDALPDADIADALGCTETTVRGHAARGLARLRVQMAVALPTSHTAGGTQ